jgi:hypothetical protein
MAVSAALALKNALDAGREDILKKDPKHWIPLCKSLIFVYSFTHSYIVCFFAFSFGKHLLFRVIFKESIEVKAQ